MEVHINQGSFTLLELTYWVRLRLREWILNDLSALSEAKWWVCSSTLISLLWTAIQYISQRKTSTRKIIIDYRDYLRYWIPIINHDFAVLDWNDCLQPLQLMMPLNWCLNESRYIKTIARCLKRIFLSTQRHNLKQKMKAYFSGFNLSTW